MAITRHIAGSTAAMCLPILMFAGTAAGIDIVNTDKSAVNAIALAETNMPGTVTVSFGLRPTGGPLALAVWVAGSDGSFVKTLAVYGRVYLGRLHKWETTSGTNKVDAVTSATPKAAQDRSLSWDCRDASGRTVRNGKYSIMVELVANDRNWQGGLTVDGSVQFTKGPLASSNAVEDISGVCVVRNGKQAVEHVTALVQTNVFLSDLKVVYTP